MSYFDSSFNDFWADLAFNNNKTWFDENRKRYEQVVKNPWETFILDLVEEVRIFTPIDDLKPGKFSSRINRDIRFSNDKTPYNTHLWAGIAEHGKKTEAPGFYIHLGIDGLSIAGGYYMPTKEHLLSVRREIMKRPDVIPAILNSKGFKSHWNELLSDNKNKILPAEFKQAATTNPMLFYKGWTYWKTYSEQDILREDLVQFATGHYRAALPFNTFLADAIKQ